MRYLSFSSSVYHLQIGFYSLPTANLHGTNELESIRNVEWRRKKTTLVNGYFEMYRSFNGAVSRSKFYKQVTNEDTIDDIIQYAEYGKMFM